MALTISDTSATQRLLNIISRLDSERNVTLARLATMKRINRASDDPAGLIALKSLEAEKTAVDTAIENNQRTGALLDTADGALAEVSSLLSDIQRLVLASVGDTATAAEKAANQAQIDSAIESIDRIMNTTQFNGRAVFGGDNRITATLTAGDAAHVKDVRVYGRPPGQTSTTLTVNVTEAATYASTSGTSIANITSNLSATTVLSITGKEGNATITLASGSSLAEVISTINASKGLTGVSATSSGTQLKLTSVDYGSEAFISVAALSGDTDVVATANVNNLRGSDAVVTVNGQAALVSGTEFHYSGNGVSLSANLATNATGTRTIRITGGGATFQLGTGNSSRATISLGDLTSSALGRSDLGYLADLKSGGSASIANDPNQAALIASKAVTQVATAAGRIGGFQKYQVQATTRSLMAVQEGLAGAISQIEDANVAQETARLERQNLLRSTSLALMGLVSGQGRDLLSLLR